MGRSKGVVRKAKSKAHYPNRKTKKDKEPNPLLFSVGAKHMDLDDFIKEHPIVTGYRFIIYGHPTEEEVSLLSKGLFVQLKSYELDVFLVIEIIDEESARAFDKYQGTSLCFVVASQDNYEDLIKETILGGFKFLRFKGEYLGKQETNVNV